MYVISVIFQLKKKKAFSPEILQPENQQVNDTRGQKFKEMDA